MPPNITQSVELQRSGLEGCRVEARPVTGRGPATLKKFSPTVEKCVGNSSGFFRRFTDPSRVPRIENRVPTDPYRVPNIFLKKI